jgi:hypothetical protein
VRWSRTLHRNMLLIPLVPMSSPIVTKNRLNVCTQAGGLSVRTTSRWGRLVRRDAAELVPSVPGPGSGASTRREERVTVTLLLTAGILAGAGAG